MIRTRKEQQQVKKDEYDELIGKAPKERAKREFKRKAYEIHDVGSYIRKKYTQNDE